MFWIGLIVGSLIGSFVMVAVLALCAAAGDNKDE